MFFVERSLILTLLFFIQFFASNHQTLLAIEKDDLCLKSAHSQETKICLTMIVKNESKIIERCLNSVRDIIDCLSICDTGSTDNTVELVEKFMRTTGIPGKVYHHEWKNFGHNRSLSVRAAEQTISELGFIPNLTYFLTLDADMMLVIRPDFDKQKLIEDSYSIYQKDSGLIYSNLRLLKGSLPWQSIGVTHEYWSSPFPHKRKHLAALEIDDKRDGGSKADKFDRDIKLLQEGLSEEPNNERYMFYLAQSYFSLKNYPEAIKWYKARIEKGGWKEEVWFSKLMLGEIYQELGEWNNAIIWYLDAYQDNPVRAETLHRISKHYRLNGKNELAYFFAQQGLKIPFPKDQILFISHPVYQYQFDEEISIVAYYVGKKEEGLASSDRLILNKDVPPNIKQQAYINLLYYIENIKNVRYIPIEINLPYVKEGSASKYNPMNPSIVKTKEGYRVICRTVNYLQFGATTFKPIDPTDEFIRTRNFLLEYDKNFDLLTQNEIIEDLKRPKYFSRKIEGLEDCRIICLNQDNWFTCTTNDTSPSKIEISLCKLAKKTKGQNVSVEKLIPLRTPSSQRCEKNWLPFTINNTLHLIYGYNPLIVLKPNINTGECTEVLRYEPKQDFSNFRGSAGPVEFDNGYLIMVHEVAFKDQRFYLNRFLYLDKNFIPLKISKPFYFRNKGVEICLGMTKDHEGNELIMALGVEDREAYLAIIDLDTVRSMLERL